MIVLNDKKISRIVFRYENQIIPIKAIFYKDGKTSIKVYEQDTNMWKNDKIYSNNKHWDYWNSIM